MSKTCLVHDYGLFCYHAERLARDFDKVYYYVPWEGSYPTPDKAFIGTGVEGLTRVTDFWGTLPKVDMVAFFDVYSGGLQRHLRDKGYNVFGTDRGEVLELDRVKFRDIMKSLAQPVAPYAVVKGLQALKDHLRDKQDKWVKVSAYRGAGETFHWKSWKHSHPLVDGITKKIGEYAQVMEFLVEDPIPGVEIGSDWFVMNGKHLPTGMYGYECKDAGYIGKACTYNALPEPIMQITEALETPMTKYGVSGLVSTEIRCNGENYLTDPCMRSGSPPGEVMCEMYENFPEVVWAVAHNESITPKMKKKYCAEILLKSDWARENWCAIDFPKEARPYLKFRNLCKIGSQHYYVPQDAGYIIGASIGLGNTLEEAQVQAMEYAEQCEAEGLYWDAEVFDKTDDYLMQGKKCGLGRF